MRSSVRYNTFDVLLKSTLREVLIYLIIALIAVASGAVDLHVFHNALDVIPGFGKRD